MSPIVYHARPSQQVVVPSLVESRAYHQRHQYVANTQGQRPCEGDQRARGRGAVREPLINLIREGMEHNEYSNKFVMITYEGYLEASEMQYLDSLSTIMQNHGSFQFIINSIEPHSDFTVSVDIKKGLKTL